jgi:hypothetical protein
MLAFQATDTSGNLTTSPALAVQVDLTPPVVAVTWPTPNLVFGSATVTATVSVQDGSPIQTVTLGDGLHQDLVTSLLDATTHQLTADFVFENSGLATLTVTATDKAGNVGQTSVQLAIDIQAPVLSFEAAGRPLLDGAAFGRLPNDLLLLTTRVDSSAGGQLVYYFSGPPWSAGATFAAGSGTTDLESISLLSEGNNTITVFADTTDPRYGPDGVSLLPSLESSLTASFVYDKTPPSGAITVPAEGSVVAGAFELSGTAVDACPSGAVCSANGLTGVSAVSFNIDALPAIPAVSSGGVWTASFGAALLGPGNHQVTMTMVDGVGNAATTPPTNFTTGGLPTVSFTGLAEGSTLPASTFDVSADAAAGGAPLTQLVLATGAKSYKCTTGAGTGDTLSCTWADFDFGALCKVKAPATCAVTFTATATDAAGATASAVLDLTVDPSLKTPLRHIASPKSGATVRGTIKLVTLQAGAGFNNVTCTANGAKVGSSANGKLTASIDTLPLVDGPLVLACTWTDAAGRTDTKTETVQVQNWLLEVEPGSLDLRGCSAKAKPVLLELEGFGHRDPASGPTVGLLQPAAQAGKLSVHVVQGKVDHASTLVPVAYSALRPSTDDRAHPLELILSLDRCTLIKAAKEALSGSKLKDADDKPVTLQLRQGTTVLDSVTLHLKGH